LEIRNQTKHVAGLSVQLDKDGGEHMVVCVRGTWSLDDRGRLALMDEPPPFLPVDECVGEPGLSTVRWEADLGPMKPGTDCALTGYAVAPKGRARAVDVSFRCGPVAKKARVTGERRRLFWLLRWWNSPPASFQRVPLQWELAKGGSDTTPKNEKQHSLDLRNPLGRSFRTRGSKLRRMGAPLPQILAPAGCLGVLPAREPGGFGLTGNHWAHRRKYAGTYDDAWKKNRAPLLPVDFDERFHLAAAPGLSTETHLKGGEPVEIAGCTRGGKLAFRLPRVALDVKATLGGPPEPIEMKLVTVQVDTASMQLRLTWRGDLYVHGRFPKLTRVDVAERRRAGRGGAAAEDERGAA
jgi:hypothetical protein